MPPQGAYGIPGYGPNQNGYEYQTSAPLPLGQAISELPNQYIKVLTKPSAFTFAAEMGKASWDIVWVQLIAYAVIIGILEYLRTIINEQLLPSTITTPMNTQLTQAIAVGASFGSLLISVPIGIISSALGLVPLVGGLAAFGLGVYGIVLQIFSLMPVHRLSGGKATAVVLIPLAILIVLVIVGVIILFIIIAASLHNSLQPSY
jgi:hypothetical protein